MCVPWGRDFISPLLVSVTPTTNSVLHVSFSGFCTMVYQSTGFLVPVTSLTTVGHSFMNSKIAVISQVPSFRVHTIWLGLCLNSKVLDICVRGLDWSTALQINTEFIPFQPNSRSPHHRKREELRLVTQGSLSGGTQTLTCSLRNSLLILLYSLGTTSVSPVEPSLECHVSTPCSMETFQIGFFHLAISI